MVDIDQRVAALKQVAGRPMRRGSAPIEEPGTREEEGTAAD
jgi:hypothetical protein